MIICPNCGTEIALSQALHEQYRHENEARFAALAGRAEAKAREDFALERQLLETQLAEERKKRESSQQAELELRKEKGALEDRARELDLEVARRVDGEKQRLEETLRRGYAEQQDLKLKEKDKLIDDLRHSLEEARRKSEQGSTQRQGEVLELDVEAELARRFPHDLISAVAKGARGADLIHEVRDAALRACGTIVRETKNTRHWHQGWFDKVKEDQRAIGANLAVIVSVALPDGIVEFGRIDGVWIASLRAWPALALALREQLIEVAFAHAAADGKHEKDGVPLPLPGRRPVPPPHRGEGGGLHRAAVRAQPRAHSRWSACGRSAKSRSSGRSPTPPACMGKCVASSGPACRGYRRWNWRRDDAHAFHFSRKRA